MATLSSILAWRILWREEPGRLQSVGFPGLNLLACKYNEDESEAGKVARVVLWVMLRI